jgi:hypothetical protein
VTRMPLRLYWNYPHLVGRFQEVTLFLQAGIEVVCALDHLPSAEADLNYHNEMHELYPAWRRNLKLANDISEQIRAFNPYVTKGQATPELQALINDHIDIIYAGGQPDVVEGLGEWFTGTVLFRVMGFPNWVGQQTNFRKLNDIVANPAFKSRFVLSCGYEGLVPNRYGHLTRNRAEINGWVDEERVLHRWAEAVSDRCAVTAISYLHFHAYFRDQYFKLARAISDFPFRVVGKNNKAQLDINDSRIVGELDFSELYQSIAGARVFIDAGHYPSHLIWPPVEAAMMGVPVLFLRTSGLVDPLRAAGYDFQSLYEVGMFNTFDELNAWLAQNGDDIALLAGIARRQKIMFADHTFGRETAMKAVKKHIIEKPWNFTNPARMDISKQEKKSRLQAQYSKDAIVSQELTPLMLDAGESRWFMPQQMRTLKGRVERRNKGRPTLVLNPKTDQAGQVIETFLPPVKAGWYMATLMVEVYEGHDGPVLEAELGRWDGASFVAERANLHQAVPGLAELEFELAVRPGAEDVSRELRVLWSGKGSLGIIGLRLDAAPYPDWLGTEHRP